jgi:hypothetical protein
MKTAALLNAAALASALKVSLDKSGSYSVTHTVKGAEQQLFSSADGIAAFVDGAWQTVGAGLVLTGSGPVSGTDVGLGSWTGTQLTWTAGKGTPFETVVKNYDTGSDVAFEYSFPKGAEGTSLVAHAGLTRDEVIVNFPAFTTVKLDGKLSWEGSFVGAKTGQYSAGAQGGPTVFFDPADDALATVVVGSALNNFKSTSAGPNKSWKKNDAWAPGNPGTITSLPAGWNQVPRALYSAVLCQAIITLYSG